MHFQHTFWLQRASCPWLIITIFPRECYGLMIKYTISHHPNRCIKVGNKPSKAALFVVHTIFFFCKQTRPRHSVMLSSDLSFLCMSKNCSISVIYSSSNKFIFCTIHFSFTQLHQMLLLFSNNEVKQKPLLVNNICGCLILVATSLPWFHSTSIFKRLYFYFVPDCLAIYFQCVIIFKQTTIKQLDGILWNPVFIWKLILFLLMYRLWV